MTLKQLSSVITTDQKEASSKDQTSPTKNGVPMLYSGEQQQKAVARLLEIADPREVDKRVITSLVSLKGLSVKPVEQTRFPKDSDVEIILLRYDIDADSIETIDSALSIVNASLTPLPEKDIIKQLAMLATLVVKPSGETAKDQQVRIKSLTSQLIKYPADIVLYAVQKVGESCTFWPAYAEFHKHIEWRMKKRTKLMQALASKKVAMTA